MIPVSILAAKTNDKNSSQANLAKMNFVLPNKAQGQPAEKLSNPKSLVVIGANGAGKTRFGAWIEDQYLNLSHRITAQKSLSIPFFISPKNIETAEKEFLYGFYDKRQNDDWHTSHGRRMHRWGNNPYTNLLNDFEKLLVLLFTEDYEKALDYKSNAKKNNSVAPPESKMDKIKRIWEKLLPHRELIIKPGKIETNTPDNPLLTYHASEMSDGERVMLYMIGEVLCVNSNSIIIIDEPELHLHKSILQKLWDTLEREREDCIFVYLTHDLGFAATRFNADKIWLKSYNGNNQWDYQVLPKDEFKFPEEVLYEILGSRNPIIFIEGTRDSWDYKVYEALFDNYTIIPIGDCDAVINSTRVMNRLKSLHNHKVFGIIDLDKRFTEDSANFTSINIILPKFATIENFFLLEEVLSYVACNLYKEPGEIIDTVKTTLFNFFEAALKEQILESLNYLIRRQILEKISSNGNSYEEAKYKLLTLYTEDELDQKYQELKKLYENCLSEKDYGMLLQILKNKSMIGISLVATSCGLNHKNQTFCNYVINFLKSDKKEAIELKKLLVSRYFDFPTSF